MFRNNRSVKPLLLAGVAAAAYYAYTRMSPEQKKSMLGSIRQQGKDLLGQGKGLLDKFMPNNMTNQSGADNSSNNQMM